MEWELNLLLDLFASSKGINNLLKVLLAHTHIVNELSLHFSMILGDIGIKSLDTTTSNSDHDRLELVLQSDLTSTNKVALLANVDDWNSYFHSLDHLLDLLIKLITFSWLENNRGLSEQLVTILFN